MLSGVQFEARWRKRACDEAEQKEVNSHSHSFGFFGAMANFQPIAECLIEEPRLDQTPNSHVNIIVPFPHGSASPHHEKSQFCSRESLRADTGLRSVSGPEISACMACLLGFLHAPKFIEAFQNLMEAVRKGGTLAIIGIIHLANSTQIGCSGATVPDSPARAILVSYK